MNCSPFRCNRGHNAERYADGNNRQRTSSLRYPSGPTGRYCNLANELRARSPVHYAVPLVRGPLRLFSGTWFACHVPLTVLRGLELFPTEPLANYTLPPTLYRRNCRLNYLIRIGLRLLNQAGMKNFCCRAKIDYMSAVLAVSMSPNSM